RNKAFHEGSTSPRTTAQSTTSLAVNPRSPLEKITRFSRVIDWLTGIVLTLADQKNWAASLPNPMVSCRFSNHYFRDGCLRFTRQCLKFRPAKSIINCRRFSSKVGPAIPSSALFFVRLCALRCAPWPTLPLYRAPWLSLYKAAHALIPASLVQVK